MSNVFEQSPLHPLKQNSDDIKKCLKIDGLTPDV